jgi:outer membrane protein assembly factor BamB
VTDSTAPLRTLTCPTCGAPLEINVDAPTIHCQYCNASIENPEYHPPQTPGLSPIQIHFDPPAPVPRRKLAAVFGWAIFIFLLAVGAGVFFFVRVISNAAPAAFASINPLQIQAPAVLLNSDSEPNVITVARDPLKDGYGIYRLGMTSHKALWHALDQKDYLPVSAILTGDTDVYLVIDTRLVALQLSDGRQAWEASLPDKLSGGCKRCIVIVKGKVVVLTTDGSLGAYDALTGHQSWEKRLDLTGDTLYPVAGGVALNYRAGNDDALGVFDAASGSELTHIVPTCQTDTDMTDTISSGSSMVIDPSGETTKAYILYGLFNACVQRWDLASGSMDWEYVEKDQNLDNSRDTPALLAAGKLIYTQDDQLRTLDAATGQDPQILDASKDYHQVPLLVSGDRLVVRATRSRGTTSYELWGYDLPGGKNLWKHPTLKSAPLDPPDGLTGLIDTDQSGWTYLETPAGMWLVTFQSTPRQVTLAQINLDTGELSGQKILPLGGDSSIDFYDAPEHIASQDHLGWFAVNEGIYTIDPQAGAFSYRWP